MDFEFDQAKDAANLLKHGLPLSDAVAVFNDPTHIVVASHRPTDNEDRFKAIGAIGGRCHTVIYVWRNDICRFISFRPSNPQEIKRYEQP